MISKQQFPTFQEQFLIFQEQFPLFQQQFSIFQQEIPTVIQRGEQQPGADEFGGQNQKLAVQR